ncbi:AI-2E family transporter [Verminephrobacter aporrectodeae subsp. tuberculatae]|uniref:AI-2E family transporter n=1 Tax=Verminephrobacter aporrectodeae subsp. tuberculatae TaxID=1110392 RepID=A0ABT3KNX7_9BURK|nr:AI-2E family transporter [Verminephrobacter aporrectodeae]MCW5221429.1 AI-2E family transporter [Verminephrobacter aporrectodeae subsp. tuberculatae]MCW5290720.1 AI-2E family transporter [Verminephrobacter aporrectodeae subsp. tuberculatae]MCW5320025.1 AI-2E family transporter [Verminephrobacter aporrectodeae subsp. tuberculatae]MCW8164687.1 AI-2E family transporter [Verminephrobacter aporrectodeae subsp. tuberculatae]MCW8169355.1 AI-2E family transporter [Verminephrobacter aporrectodeae su
MTPKRLQDKAFLLLLILVTMAFGAILWQFHGAVFWGVVLAILFAPLHRRLLGRMPRRPTLAALCTLGLCLVVVILPTTAITVSLVHEASAIYARVRSGQIDFGLYLQQMIAALPAWVANLLDRLDLTSVAELQRKLSSVAVQASQFVATQALSMGQNALEFIVSLGIMLYLLFFLLRDGAHLAWRVGAAVPLGEAHKRQLIGKFTTVIRATVKGNIVVAVSQGALGGLIFGVLGIQGPVLWGVFMAFLSLLPAVGAGLIWAPVAIYFLVTGSIWKGVVLTAFGLGVIGLVDNVLRPILVGKDTKMPDYVVLISTLGGMALFGLTGFVMGPVIAALFIASWDLFCAESAGPRGSPALANWNRLRGRRRRGRPGY